MKTIEVPFQEVEKHLDSYAIAYNLKYEHLVLETIDKHQLKILYSCICPYCGYWLRDWENYFVAKAIDGTSMSVRCRKCSKIFQYEDMNLRNISISIRDR